MCKCNICDKEYDDYEFTGRIVNLDTDSEIEHVCWDCFEKEMKNQKYWFKSHVPGFVDGVPISLVVSNDKSKILDFLKKHTREEYILCSDYKCDGVVDVKKDKSEWWVRGYLSKQIGSPFDDWKVVAGV